MAVLQMQRISICALKKDRKAILEKIQSMGIMEMNQVAEGEEGFEKMDTFGARQRFEKKASLTDNALDILDIYAPEKKSMFASLEGKALVDADQFTEITGRKDEILKKADRLVACNKEIAEHRAEITKLENQIEALVPWLELDVPMNLKGTGKTELLLGTMPGETELSTVYEKIAENCPETEGVDVQIIHKDQDATYLAVLCLKTDAAAVEEALRAAGFARPSQATDAVPAKKTAELKEQIEQLNTKIGEIEEEIKACADDRGDLKVVGDYFRMRAKKYEVLGTLPQSQRAFVISGYIPKKAAPAVEKAIGDHYDCVIDIDEIKEDEEPPTVLQNNAFSSSVEGVLEAYGLPHKGEFDPTTIMSFFYVFFFGMMLSDAAYGAIVAIACFVALKKYPRMSASMHKSLKLFFFCGLSTIVWGILFSGYFGDAVDVIGRTFFGVDVTVPPLWFAPLNNPMKLLMYSMLFGVIHLFTGLALKGYICLRDRRYLDFFCDCVLWFMLLLGLIGILLPTELFAGIAGQQIVLPAPVVTGAKWMAVAGAVGIVLMSGRGTKNIGVRLALGAYDLYNVTGWLSDVLSYSRLLALGLATGVIASVINQMGSMGGKSVPGVIIFIVVFIVGHTFNIGINLLGAYVHTCRLQYVEFFGKFYEGGGREFHPFHRETKYVDIKEEKELC